MSIVSSRIKVYSDALLTHLVATVNGTTAASQAISVTGLNASTQYWVQAEATDNNGLTGTSAYSTFTTSAANYSWSGLGVDYTQYYNVLDVNISVSCQGASFTECGIQFSTSSDFSGSIISGSNTTLPADDFTDEVSGFAEHTTYYYRYFATSTEYGTQYYAPQGNTITTHYAQPVVTLTHSNVTDTTATVTATYTGNMPLDHSTCSFTYVEHGQSNPIYINIDNMVAGTPYSANLSGLTPNTRYDIEFDAEYYDGEVTVTDSLTTLQSRPTVAISGVSNVTPSSAQVNITIS